MLLMTTVLAVLAVGGPGVVTQNVPPTVEEIKCCPFLADNQKDTFNICKEELPAPLSCEKHLKKCEFNHMWYEQDHSIALWKETCTRVWCHPPKTMFDKRPFVYIEILHENCQCCENKGKLYPEGHLLNTVVQGCSRLVCKDGSWVTELDNNCCIHQEKVFFPGEVMEVGPEATDCWQLWCDNGDSKKKESDCCCKQKNKMYECGVQISISTETCTIEMCQEGTIIRKDNQGCCVVEGKVYTSGEVVQPGVETCKDLVCDKGDVVQKPSTSCCKDLEGNLYLPNQVVEKHAKKCMLKVCQSDGTIADRSIADICSCCELGGHLYPEGASVSRGPCLSLTCRDNTWHTAIGECTRCYGYGDPHYKTFDGSTYNFYAKCNYTMLQQGLNTATERFIAAHLKVCGPPFKFDVSCNGEITIKHSKHVAVTITTSHKIKVNGAVVALPFSLPSDTPTGENLVMLDTGEQFIIATFNGFVVQYVKHDIMNGVYIYAPPAENRKEWYGLCGDFNSKRDDDFVGRNTGEVLSKEQFALSWSTGESEYREQCRKQENTTNSRCTDELTKQWKPKCEDLMKGSCDSPVTYESCLEDMCSCQPGLEDTCYLILKHMIEKACGLLMPVCPGKPIEEGSDCPAGLAEGDKHIVDCSLFLCTKGKMKLEKVAEKECCAHNNALFGNGEVFQIIAEGICYNFLCDKGEIAMKGQCDT